MPQTDWKTDVQESVNRLIVSGGELAYLNPFPWYGPEVDWFSDVVFTNFGLFWGRTTEVNIFQVLGGEDVHGAESCAWGHAVYGSNNNQLWNGSTTDADDSSDGSCRLMFPGNAPTALNGGTAQWSLTYSDPGGFAAPAMVAFQHHQAVALWLRRAKEEMPWYGAWVGTLDKTGIPAGVLASGDYTLEVEGELELVKIEVTPDRADRDADLDGSVFYFNDLYLPDLTQEEAAWSKGALPGGPDPTGREFREIAYDGGAPDWVELEAYTSWEDTQPLDGSAPFPDESLAHTAAGGGVLNSSASSSDHMAVRYTFLAPRYRWVWDTNPVTRQYPRDDGRGISSAPRLYPPTKAGRLAGGYS